jgi:adenylate cyclase
MMLIAKTMSQRSLQFGLFTLDLQKLCLQGPSGEVELRPKSFEVLRYLVEHPGRVISKEEVMAAVWPDVVVTDDSLIRCISELRRAIGDEDQATVKTVPRRGYLFQVPVSPQAAPRERLDDTGVRSRPGKAAPAEPSARPSIVVLPFANLAGDPDEDYLSNGITEDILTELSRFSELRVIGRHSSFHYKDKEIVPGQISRELGVGYILEGSIQRGRDRVRITAQLTDATSGAHLWAERYDRTLDDVFAIQDEVVRTIAPLLVAHVRKAEVERTLLKPPATWQAYHYFMRGLDLHLAYQSSQDVSALHEARRLLEQSIAIDPAYARPYSALAVSHLSSWANYGDVDFLQSAALERAQEFARHAVQLDPQLAYAQATFAHVLTWARQHEVALGALQRALWLNPSYSHWQVAEVLMFAGELDRAVEGMQAYMRLDPFHPTSAIGWLGVAYFTLGRLTEALTLLRDAVARSPKRAMFQYWLAATYGQLGDVEAAQNQARTLLALQPAFTIMGTARPLAVFRSGAHADHFLAGLHKSGLPM